MVTIKDIAKAVGVSYSTVSRALNHQRGTNPETRDRILKAAAEMGYEPNAIARSLVTNRSNTLAFVLPDLSNPFFTSILQAAEHEADERGYQLLICETRWETKKEKQEIKLLSEKRVDGILLYPTSAPLDESYAHTRTPMVVFGYAQTNLRQCCSFVEVNNEEGCRKAVEHMLERGYQRLAYLGGPNHSTSSHTRHHGFLQTLKEHGLTADPDLISEGKFDIETGYSQTQKLLAMPQHKRPDGLICGNDMIALGALQALAENDVAVPEEMGVIGFDDVRFASLPQIQLTTIKIPCEDMGLMGTRLLLDRLHADGDHAKSSPNCRMILEPQLIERKTTRTLTTRTLN